MKSAAEVDHERARRYISDHMPRVPVAAVIVMVLLTVVIAAVLYVWAGSFITVDQRMASVSVHGEFVNSTLVVEDELGEIRVTYDVPSAREYMVVEVYFSPSSKDDWKLAQTLQFSRVLSTHVVDEPDYNNFNVLILRVD